MSVKIELDVWVITKEMTSRVMTGINKALPVLLEELKRLTPEDTGNMLQSYVVKPAKVDWNTVIWEIGNTAWYAIYVEYGVGWVSFNYHKPKGSVFFHWIGNRTFARAVDNTRSKIENIILSELNR